MPLTRATVEAKLVNDWSAMLGTVGMSVVVDGTNPNLNWPIASALLYLNITPFDLAGVADSELARVPPARTLYFLALAHVYTAEAILGNARSMVDTQVGINRESLEQMAEGLELTIARLWEQIAAQFVRGRAQVLVGKMAPDPQPPDAVCLPWITGS